MKKLALTIAFALISICGFAQNIKFHGIPLGIGVEQFGNLLKQKGYTQDDTSGDDPISTRNMTYYSGVFAGSEVYLSVMSTPKSKLVQVVSISFPEYFTNATGMTELLINRKFDEVKASLNKKYPNAKKTTWNNGYIIKAYMLESSKWQINLSVQVHDGIKGLHLLYVDKDASATAKHENEMDY